LCENERNDSLLVLSVHEVGEMETENPLNIANI